MDCASINRYPPRPLWACSMTLTGCKSSRKRRFKYKFHTVTICDVKIVIVELPEKHLFDAGSDLTLKGNLKKRFRHLSFGLVVATAVGVPELSRTANEVRDIQSWRCSNSSPPPPRGKTCTNWPRSIGTWTGSSSSHWKGVNSHGNHQSGTPFKNIL
jgi:hypothetical protein